MYQIFNEGQFIPSIIMRRGEKVLHLGVLYTVAVPGPGWWMDTDGNRHEGGAYTAVDVTESPAAVMDVYLALWTKGVL